MSTSTTPNGLSSAYDDRDVVEYAPVSRAAIIACGLGCASIISLVAMIFWAIPIAAIVFAIFGLRQIAQSPQPILGKQRAIVGLCLAFFFLAWSATHFQLLQNRFGKHAGQMALQWAQMVHNEQFEDAHRLTLPYLRRQQAVSNSEEPPEREGSKASPFAHFLHKECVIAIRSAGKSARFYLENVDRAAYHADDVYVPVEIVMESESDQATRRTPLYLLLKRELKPQSKIAYWNVERAETKPIRPYE